MKLTAILNKVEEPPSWLWGDTGATIETRECDRLLCSGCREGKMETVQEAIGMGANPRVQFRLALGEITPIFLCASKGYNEIAEFLIEHNKEIIKDTMGFDGTTCLHHAASNDQPKMCDLLINKGCKVDCQDKLGRTALMDAAEIGSVEVITVLNSNKANLDQQDMEGHTAISYALDFITNEEDKFFNAAHCLVKNGASPDYAGKFTNRTLLHYVASQGQLEQVKSLVEKYCADPLLADDCGRLPVDYAKENKHHVIVDYLEQVMPEQSACFCNIM